MRAVVFTVLVLVGTAQFTGADDIKQPPKPTGILVELRGPPEGGNFTITYALTIEGLKEPHSVPISYGNYRSDRVEGEIVGWETAEFVVEKAGETRIRFLGWKDKTGKLHPITAVKIESKDLPANQLPKVVPDPKNKG